MRDFSTSAEHLPNAKYRTNLIRLISFVILSSLYCGVSQAAVYRFGLTGNNFTPIQIPLRLMETVNGRLIYLSVIGKFGPYAINAYDAEENRSRRLLVTEPGPVDVKFHKAGKFVLVENLGRLFITRGTAASTTFIKDFGFFTSGSVGPEFSNIRATYVADDLFYFLVRNEDTSRSFDYRLWVLNPASAQIKMIDTQALGVITGALDNQTSSNGEIFLITDNQRGGFNLWGNSSNDYSQFSLFDSHSSPLKNLTGLGFVDSYTNSKGSYFCTHGVDQSGGFSAIERTLWRVSNTKTIDRLSSGCSDAMVVLNDRLYFERRVTENRADGRGLWVTNGIVGNLKEVLALGPAYRAEKPFNGRVESICTLKNSIYLNDSDGSSIARRIFSIGDNIQLLFSNKVFNGGIDCLKSKLILNRLPGRFEQKSSVYDGEKIISIVPTVGTIAEIDGKLYATKYNFTTRKSFIGSLKLNEVVPLPGILQLLD